MACRLCIVMIHSHPTRAAGSGESGSHEGPALPIVLDPAQPEPFYQQIVDQVRQLVLTGRLPPGFALPSVRVLASQLGTSVMTTRRAYDELERAGLIVTRQGTGSFVASLGPEERRRHLEAYALAVLGETVERLLATGLSGDELRRLLETVLEKKAGAGWARPESRPPSSRSREEGGA